VRSPERQAQIDADGISYVWDALIEKFNHHILTGTQYYPTGAGVGDSECNVRWLAREPRTRRRMLAGKLASMIETTPHTARRASVVLPSRPGDPHYVFLLLPEFAGISEAEYREVRRELLLRYCMVVKLKWPDALDIVGIATEVGEAGADPRAPRSEDLVSLDARKWTPEYDEEARSLQHDLGLLLDVTQETGVEREFPVVPPAPTTRPPISRMTRHMKGRDRNAPCPCGSGKKLKKCCGA